MIAWWLVIRFLLATKPQRWLTSDLLANFSLPLENHIVLPKSVDGFFLLRKGGFWGIMFYLFWALNKQSNINFCN